MAELMPVEQKMVSFNGAELLGVKASDGKVYVGVRWVCEGVGLSRGQLNNEVVRVQTDVVLKQGARNFVFQKMDIGKGGKQEALTLDIEFLPLWLAKISITPTMLDKQPDVANNLVEYQLKAKDVLADAFIRKQPSYMIDDEILRAERWIEEKKEHHHVLQEKQFLEQKVKESAPKLAYYDVILKSKSTVTTTQIAKDYGLTAPELNKILHEQKIQYKVNDQWILYKKYADKGYVQSETFEFKRSDGSPDVKMNTKWTQRGRIFIHQVLTELGIKPNIEKEYFDAN